MEMTYHLVYVKDFLKFIFNKISSKAGAKIPPWHNYQAYCK